MFWVRPHQPNPSLLLAGHGQPGPTPHLYRQALGQPGPPTPHFYRQAPGQPGPPNPSPLSTGTPHFYRQGPGQPGLPKPSLLSTGLRPAQPSPSLHFYRQGLGRPGPQPFTFIDRAQASPAPKPSLLSTGPRPARPPKPSLLLANPSVLLARPLLLSARPSFLLAKPARANPENCAPPEPPGQLLCGQRHTLIAHCHIFLEAFSP